MKSFYFLKHMLFLWLYLMVCSRSDATTIEVGHHLAINSIRHAISIAHDGDTVIVQKGTYTEGNLVIDKKISLIGIGQPIIDGQKKHEPISIKSPQVTVKGFWIKGSGQSSMNDMAGIKIYNTSDVYILDNTLEDNFFGIYFQASTNCVAENNTLMAYGKAEQLSGNGIHAWKSDSLYIRGNSISGHRDGIYLEFVTHTQVEKNQSRNNIRYGLHFMFSHDNAYYRNHFIRNGAGVAVMYTRHVKMEHNVFDENWGDAAYGLLLKDISDSEIRNNTFSRNTTAILMEGSNRVHIEYNQIENNGWGLKIQANCMDNTLQQNNFINNTFDVATNGNLVLNTFRENYWDKYEGYDLDKNGLGDIPYRPVSLFSMIVEKYPMVMLLFRSFMSKLLDRTERIAPSLTPESLKDNSPHLKPITL